MKDQIKKAIGAHGLWKSRLQDAIASGKCDFTVANVSKDNLCDFGKWLYGDAKASSSANPSRYEAVRTLHAKFHAEVGKVLDIALKGSGDKALALLGDNSDFAKASANLTREMMLWVNEA